MGLKHLVDINQFFLKIFFVKYLPSNDLSSDKVIVNVKYNQLIFMKFFYYLFKVSNDPCW